MRRDFGVGTLRESPLFVWREQKILDIRTAMAIYFLSSSISFFFFKKRTHSSDGWMQKKSRQNERKSLLSLRVFSPQKKSLNLSHHHHHHHHLLSIHTSLYRTERRLNHFSGGREDASKKRSSVSESVTHRNGEF